MKPFAAFLFSLLMFSFTDVAAQQHAGNTLLWRISGNGLTQPSYLFGTIHLSNQELFHFGDSVYKAIEQTKGFAIEVNPDEMATYYINKMFDDLSNGKKISSLMDNKKFNEYKAGLSKKFNKPAEEITTEDILKEKNKWVSELMEKGEMPTFMDAYLYNIARKQGKWLGGIEDIADQASLSEDLVDATDIDNMMAEDAGDKQAKTALNRMIQSYLSEDITAIEKMSSANYGAKKDMVLIRRNHKMAMRMDSLSALRSMFFAVGAAHLPGNDGVIDLLRKRGFDVQPVYSKSRTDARNYKYKEIDVPWVQVEDAQNLYKVTMPGKPTDIRPMGLMHMKFFMDLFNLSGYYTMAVVHASAVNNYDSIFQQVATNFLKGKQASKAKVIDRGEVHGREYVQQVDKGMMRLQVYMKEKVLYIAGLYSLNKTNIYGRDADRFFNSFLIKQKAIVDNNLHPFIDSIIGVKVIGSSPWEYNAKYSKEDSSDTWQVKTYTSVDVQNGGYNFLIVKTPRPGQYIINDSTMYHDLFNNMASSYHNLSKKDTLLHGRPAFFISGDSVNEDNLSLRIYTTIRGNRNIILMSIGEPGYYTSGSGKNMFDSFELIPQSRQKFSTYTDPAKSFSALGSAPFFALQATPTPRRTNWISYDSVSGTSYSIVIDTLDQYYWKPLNDFWKEKKDQFVEKGDSLVSIQTVKNGEAKGQEYIVRLGRTGTYERSRVLVHGKVVYTLYVSVPADDLHNEVAEKFFNSFHPLYKADPYNITESKSKQLLKDLSSKDEDTRKAAAEAISQAGFTSKDLGDLHKAFLVHYSPLTPYGGALEVNERIGEKLSFLKSASTIRFLQQQYERFKDSTSFRLMIIDVLAAMYSREALQSIVTMLSTDPVKESLNYAARKTFTDSLQWTSQEMDRLSRLAGNQYHGPFIADLYLRLLDEDKLNINSAMKYEPGFISVAQGMMPALLHPDSVFDYNTYSLVTLLSKLHTPGSIEQLKTMQQVLSPYLRKRVVIDLLKAGEMPGPGLIEKLAADSIVMISFYNELKSSGLDSLFPSSRKKQSYFADAYIYGAASDEEEPVSITPLVKKKVSIGEKAVDLYLYKVSYSDGENETSYLGIAGAFEHGKEDVELLEDYSGVYYGEEFDHERLDEQLKVYLEEF